MSDEKSIELDSGSIMTSPRDGLRTLGYFYLV